MRFSFSFQLFSNIKQYIILEENDFLQIAISIKDDMFKFASNFVEGSKRCQWFFKQSVHMYNCFNFFV